MRGIAGWVNNNNSFNEENVYKMANSFSNSMIQNLGIYRSCSIRLINRSITSKSSSEYIEPLSLNLKDLGQYTIVFSGNIYNKKELKEELFKKNVIVSTSENTEIFLKSYLQWKEDCLNKINGVFSVAIWSGLKKELFLARDKIGVKPLFFYEYEGGIIFASFIKNLLSNSAVNPYVDEDGLKEIFFLGPGKTPGSGIIKGVKELLPGEFCTFSQGKLLRKTYWKLKAFQFTDSLNTAVEKTRFLLEDSIKRQLTTSQPFCCLLSGGLDSSIVSKVAADYCRERNLGNLATDSVDYHNNSKYFEKSSYQPNSDDEFINIMVDYIKSEHKMVTLSNGSLANALLNATIARGFPGMADIDASLLLFGSEVKKDFNLAFSGECSDELFGGYPWYHNKEVLFNNTFPWATSNKVRNNILKKGALSGINDYINQKYEDTLKSVDKLPKESKLSGRMREMFTLNFMWFMQTLLLRGECMSMYSDLELRVPFCDYRIVEYAYNMPWEIKALKGREKGILRQAMKGILPNEIILRKKSPYPKTHNPVYMAAVCEKVKEILKDKSSVLSDILDYDNIISLMQIKNQNSIEPWYGQLMKIPQIMAYIIQVDCFFKYFKIKIV